MTEHGRDLEYVPRVGVERCGQLLDVRADARRQLASIRIRGELVEEGDGEERVPVRPFV